LCHHGEIPGQAGTFNLLALERLSGWKPNLRDRLALKSHQPSSIIHHPSSIIHHPSSITIIHHQSSIIHHPSSITYHPSPIIHQHQHQH
jgi:hypothetical protein